MGTKNNPGAFDCYANAAPDEPMFVLLGRDKHAPTLVWLWATLRELDDEDPAVVLEARQCLADMLAWQHDHGRRMVGLGQAVLAGCLELIKAANAGYDQAIDIETDTVALIRLALARTTFEGSGA